MPENGFIKLHRKILENPVVCKDSDYFSVWCYLILMATHTEIKKVFAGKKITLKPGQLITGRISISNQFGVSESKVQRILKRLENEQQIEQQTCNQNRLITIKKWSEYQSSEQRVKQPVNNQWTTTEQQVNTNKNVKNERIEEDDDGGDLRVILDKFKQDYFTPNRSQAQTIKKWLDTYGFLTLDDVYCRMVSRSVQDPLPYMAEMLKKEQTNG